MPDANHIIARHLDTAAGMVSGLSLEDIGQDGHLIANTLWKVAAHLRNRARKNVSPDVIRAWARLNGWEVRDTGRVPLHITTAYYRAREVDPPADDL